MQVHHIGFDKVSAFSDRDVAYQIETDRFSAFYEYEPSLSGLQKALDERCKHPVDRVLLVETIRSKYEALGGLHPAQEANLDALADDNTYTVITAHQPSLFMGPLYYVLKIFSAINLAEKLTAETDYKVVPVFINGSEDHDFEEVNHMQIFGKKIEWDREASGPVGRMNLDNLDKAIDELADILGGSERAADVVAQIRDAYSKSSSYNEFVFRFINPFFAKYGVLVAGSDDVKLKQAFVPLMKRELLQRPSQALVQKAQEKLAEVGFKSQAFPREINLFYLTEGRRDRIVFEDGKYQVLDTDITFTEEQVLAELEAHPDRFSPNVVMRPLYQETIFPNVAYVGGGGELAYWLERKSQFAEFGVFFPALIRRNSAMVVTKSQIKTAGKLDMSFADLFTEEHLLINKYLEANTSFDFDLSSERDQLTKIYESIADKAKQADQTLGPFAKSEGVKASKQLDQIEGRIKRAIKSREDVSVNKIKTLKDKLFPSSGLQERKDNFFQFYLSMGDELLDALKDNLNPLEKDFVVLVQE